MVAIEVDAGGSFAGVTRRRAGQQGASGDGSRPVAGKQDWELVVGGFKNVYRITSNVVCNQAAKDE